jgi:hypothetical protein
MMPQLSTMMKDAISNVLGTMFFLVPAFAESENSRGFSQGPFFLESRITIGGDGQRLRLCFKATRAFASITTANFLGVGQEEVTTEEMEDTLKELANMVGGDCLSRLPTGGNWDLGIPVLEAPQADREASFAPNSCSLVLFLDEEKMALIRLHMEQ